MVDSKQIKILFITNNPFPIGLALSNRILSLARGVNNLGYDVFVLCVRPTEIEGNIFNTNVTGEYEGIPFSYSLTQIRNKRFIKRRINDFLSILFSFRIIFKERGKGNISLVFFGNYPIYEALLLIFCKLFRVNISKEESEHTSIYFSKNHLGIWAYKLYIKIILRSYGKHLIMTNNIIDYLILNGIPSTRIYKIPNAIDINLFDKRCKYELIPGLPTKYMAFSGSLNNSKDGILDFLDVYKYINNELAEIKLVVLGDGSLEDKEKLSIKINKLDLENHVIVVGRVNSETVPSIISNAMALVSFRPSSLQAHFGFPTKIIEYLCTGNPVITTLTGELRNYLLNNINCFVVKFDDTQNSAFTIIYLLSNKEKSKEIGHRGRELVLKEFNSELIAIDFIKAII
jgi:glycosyltransferase involved in cell wall biosynthesis